MNTNRFKQLLESSLGNAKPLLSESLDSGCLRGAGFTRESIGGPMTRRMVYQKTQNGVTYQIGITGNDVPSSELKMIKNGTTQYCSWSCDSSSPMGIKTSGCKVEERPLHEQEDMDEGIQWDIDSVDCEGNMEGHMDVNYDDDMVIVTIKYCKGDHEELEYLKKKARHQIGDNGFDF
jgi:hypothetical protein